MFTITITDTTNGDVINEAEADTPEGAALAAKTLWEESLPFRTTPHAFTTMRTVITLDGREVFNKMGAKP
jgi:hypothetical protein